MVISHEIDVKRCEDDQLTLKYSNSQRGRWPCLPTLSSRHHPAMAGRTALGKLVRVVCAGRLRAKHISNSTRELNDRGAGLYEHALPVLKGGAGAAMNRMKRHPLLTHFNLAISS